MLIGGKGKGFCDKEGSLWVVSLPCHQTGLLFLFLFFFREGGGGGCMQAHKMLEGVRGVCYMQTQPARTCMPPSLKQHPIHPELVLDLGGHLEIFLQAEFFFFLPSPFLSPCLLSFPFHAL